MSAVLNHDHFFHVVYNNLKVSNIYAFKSVGDLGENRGGCYLFVCWVFFYPEMEGTFKRYLKSIVARLSQVPARLSKGTWQPGSSHPAFPTELWGTALPIEKAQV